MSEQTLTRAQRVLAFEDGLPKSVDATALLAEPTPEVDWLIPNLMERQDRVIVVGSEGVGKSLWALTLAAQAAGGCSVLDYWPLEHPIRVMYADLEMSRRMTRRRLRPLAGLADLKPGALEIVSRPDGLELADRGERRWLLERLNAIRPDLLILDPLYKAFTTDAPERDIRPAVRFLDRLRVDFGLAILLVHHLRKRAQGESRRGRDSSDAFGSSVLLRWPEMVLILDEDRLRVEKDRDGRLGRGTVLPVVRGGAWPVSIEAPQGGNEWKVFDHIGKFGPISANQIVNDLGGRRQEVYRIVSRLAEQDRIVKKAGKWITAEGG